MLDRGNAPGVNRANPYRALLIAQRAAAAHLADGPANFDAALVAGSLGLDRDGDLVAGRSLPVLVAMSVPLFVNDAELDPDMFQDETAKLVAARAAAGKPVERVHLMGHSHISET